MRPWLQPGLYTLGARGLTALGIDDPFAWAFAFRVFSGLLAWLGLVGLALCSGRWFSEPAARRLAIRALVLAYFVPYLAVRTSAESLSTSCVVLALSIIVLRGDTARPGLAVATGALLGLACGLRYATGVMVASILAWLVLVGRTPARRLGWILLGIGVGAGGGARGGPLGLRRLDARGLELRRPQLRRGPRRGRVRLPAVVRLSARSRPRAVRPSQPAPRRRRRRGLGATPPARAHVGHRPARPRALRDRPQGAALPVPDRDAEPGAARARASEGSAPRRWTRALAGALVALDLVCSRRAQPAARRARGRFPALRGPAVSRGPPRASSRRRPRRGSGTG